MPVTIPEPAAPPRRVLMGPGPSDADPRVLRALAAPVVGHLDPWLLARMDEVRAMLRTLFGTQNRATFAISGTGTSGMEACLANLVEPGDEVVVGIHGYFGERLAEIAARHGGEVIRVAAPWGERLPERGVVAAIERVRPKVVALVHAETSTGVEQPVEAIARAARRVDALTVLDCVTSLGGMAVEVDRWGIDAAYSGSQKCLGAPPGLAPVTFSERAVAAARGRRRPVSGFYFDVALLERYWDAPHAYHHTISSPLVVALHEALRIALQDGRDARFARQRELHEELVRGLARLGLDLLGAEGTRLSMLHAVEVPAGVDEAAVRRELLETYGLEIGAGMGALKGRIWRIGLMGASCTPNHVALCVAALARALGKVR